MYLRGRSEGLGDPVFGRRKTSSHEHDTNRKSVRLDTNRTAARLEAWSEQLLITSADLTEVLAELKELPGYREAESEAKEAGQGEGRSRASRRNDR